MKSNRNNKHAATLVMLMIASSAVIGFFISIAVDSVRTSILEQKGAQVFEKVHKVGPDEDMFWVIPFSWDNDYAKIRCFYTIEEAWEFLVLYNKHIITPPIDDRGRMYRGIPSGVMEVFTDRELIEEDDVDRYWQPTMDNFGRLDYRHNVKAVLESGGRARSPYFGTPGKPGTPKSRIILFDGTPKQVNMFMSEINSNFEYYSSFPLSDDDKQKTGYPNYNYVMPVTMVGYHDKKYEVDPKEAKSANAGTDEERKKVIQRSRRTLSNYTPTYCW